MTDLFSSLRTNFAALGPLARVYAVALTIVLTVALGLLLHGLSIWLAFIIAMGVAAAFAFVRRRIGNSASCDENTRDGP